MTGNIIGKAIVFLLVFIHLAVTGCAIVGRKVPADDRIMFSEQESGQGTFSKGGLTVHYLYDLQDGKLNLSGKISYRRSVDSLQTYIWFLDAGGEVLQQKIVYSSGYRSPAYQRDRQFKKTLIVPSGAVGMTFSYSSQLPRGHK